MAETLLRSQQAFGGDGWQPAKGSWSYASASTITVPSGAASLYQIGDRIKWTQTTVKYGVIVGVADTLLTIAVNTDYTVANAAITANYYSHQANPIGYPTTFAYTTTYTGFSANPTGTVTRFSVLGNICTLWGSDSGNGTSNSTNKTFTAPIVSAASRPTAVFAWMRNNNAQVHSSALLGSASTTVNCYLGPAVGTAWTASGNCRLLNSGLVLIYEI